MYNLQLRGSRMEYFLKIYNVAKATAKTAVFLPLREYFLYLSLATCSPDAISYETDIAVLI